MNPKPFQNLANQLKANPSYFEAVDDSMLGELIFHYHEGDLSKEETADVADLIETDPKARAILERILEAERYAVSPEGKAWMESLPERAMQATPPLTRANHTIHEVFFDRLSNWIAETFSGLRLQGAYSDTAAGQHKVFPAKSDDPYKPWLVQDRMGRWYLRVVTLDADAAKVRLRLELEREMPVLEFQPKGDGEFFAQVRLTEAMAEALKSGHRPVFHPAD